MDTDRQASRIPLVISLPHRLTRTIMEGFVMDAGCRAEINRTQMRTLLYLEHHGASTMTEMCAHVNLEKGSMTTVVDSLIARDLAERIRDDQDRRKVLVSLTHSGRAAARKCISDIVRHIDGRLEVLDPADRQKFWDAVKILEDTAALLQEHAHG